MQEDAENVGLRGACWLPKSYQMRFDSRWGRQFFPSILPFWSRKTPLGNKRVTKWACELPRIYENSRVVSSCIGDLWLLNCNQR